MVDNLAVRGQEAEVSGIPSLNLEGMQGTSVPNEFEFTELFGDIIMCEYIDENENGEVYRGGVWIKMDITRKLWRRARVVLAGPGAPDVNVGDEVALPQDKGIPMVASGGRKFIFVNKERLFGKLKPVAEIPTCD